MIERLLSFFRRSPAWPSDPQEADRLFEAIVAGVGDPQTAIDHLRAMPRDEMVRRLIDQHQGPDRHAVPRLLELADDPDGRVQENARTTLIELGVGA